MTERVIPVAEVYTATVQFTSGMHGLTPIQWQIIRSTSVSSLAIGAILGALVSFFIPLVTSYLQTGQAKTSDAINCVLAAIACILFLVVGAIADRKRTKIIRMINKRLLSDEQLGLIDDI